jgi:hypothetical protein
VARGQRASLWRRRQAQKLAPLGRPQAAVSAGQAPLPPLPVDQKDRLRQAARGSAERPRRQPEHNSTAACASAERHHASQSATAWRRALLQGAAVARAQQHGGLLQSAPTPTRARAQQHAGRLFCRAHFLFKGGGFCQFYILFHWLEKLCLKKTVASSFFFLLPFEFPLIGFARKGPWQATPLRLRLWELDRENKGAAPKPT